MVLSTSDNSSPSAISLYVLQPSQDPSHHRPVVYTSTCNVMFAAGKFVHMNVVPFFFLFFSRSPCNSFPQGTCDHRNNSGRTVMINANYRVAEEPAAVWIPTANKGTTPAIQGKSFVRLKHDPPSTRHLRRMEGRLTPGNHLGYRDLHSNPIQSE